MSLEKQTLIEENLQKTFNEESFRETLSPKDFEKYVSAKQTLKFHKGETIFEDGENAKGVYFITKGTAKLSKQGVYGKEQILKGTVQLPYIDIDGLEATDASKAKLREA